MCWQGDISGRFLLIGVRMRVSCVVKVIYLVVSSSSA